MVTVVGIKTVIFLQVPKHPISSVLSTQNVLFIEMQTSPVEAERY